MYEESHQGRAEIEVHHEVDVLFTALAHPFRQAVVGMLAERETDATELMVVGQFRFGLAESTASGHLGVLRAAGLVRSYSRAPHRVYALVPAARSRLARWAEAVASAEPERWLPFDVEL